MNDESEMEFLPHSSSLFSSGPPTSSQIEWHASYGKFAKPSGQSNRKPPKSGPLGVWPKQKPICTDGNVNQAETAIQEPKTMPTISSDANTDGFSKLAEEIRLKSENMRLKLEVSKLQRDKNIEANKVTKVKIESKKQKVKEGELLKALNEMTKSRDSARKANDNNRARVSKIKKKVKRLESEKYTNGLKKEGAKEMLKKTKFTPGQVKSILNPNKKIQYSKEDVVQALVQKSLGTKAFNHMRKTAAYRIPSRQTQERWLGNLMSSMPGFQTDAILAAKELMKHSIDERFNESVIVFDEMHLSKKMELHKKTQNILGPYSKVQVVMIRGLSSK